MDAANGLGWPLSIGVGCVATTTADADAPPISGSTPRHAIAALIPSARRSKSEYDLVDLVHEPSYQKRQLGSRKPTSTKMDDLGLESIYWSRATHLDAFPSTEMLSEKKSSAVNNPALYASESASTTRKWSARHARAVRQGARAGTCVTAARGTRTHAHYDAPAGELHADGHLPRAVTHTPRAHATDMFTRTQRHVSDWYLASHIGRGRRTLRRPWHMGEAMPSSSVGRRVPGSPSSR